MNKIDKIAIRNKAENFLKEHPEKIIQEIEDNDRAIIHELQVHQIELEMQNDELFKTAGQLEAAKEEYLDLYNNAPVGYCTLDENGVVIRCNLTLSRMLAVDNALLTGSRLYSYIKEEDRDTFFLHLRGCMNEGKRKICEIEFNVNEDGAFYARLESIAFFDPMTNIHCCRTVIQDITEKKQYERELVTAKNKAEEASRLKSSFLANMSHEVRTPLTAINGFSSFLLNTPGMSEEAKISLGLIKQSGKLLLRLINDILELSKMDAGMYDIVPKPFCLDSLVTKLHCDSQILLKEKKSKVKLTTCNTSGKDIWLTGDMDRIYQVLLNLVNNAVKFTEEGFIEYGITICESSLHFYIKDTGPGIPREKYEQIFQPFVRLENSYCSKHNGTGLGLCITQKLCTLLKASLDFRSDTGENHGTTFHVQFPYCTVTEKPSRACNDTLQDTMDIKGLNVLIAEDNRINNLYFKELLSRDECFVLETFNGMEAINTFKKNPDLDVVLLDIKMPGMDGYEVCRQIREIEKGEKRQKSVIIALTALVSQAERAQCFETGFDDYISKPLESEEIVRHTIFKHLFT